MTDADRWARVKVVLQEALTRDADARMAYLDDACGSDRALRAEVESLLTAHEDAGSFANGSPLDGLPPSAVDSLGHGLSSGARLGPYKILSKLGAGGMGEVYEAHDPRLGRCVAIKVLSADLSLDASARSRFQREAKVIAALNHRHICTVHDVGHESGIDFIVMERLDGETLAGRLSRGTVPYQQAVQIAIAIADALDAAHRAGIVHRDLKPGNVMLTTAEVKLLDFGLAKTKAMAGAPRESSPPTATAEGAIAGTLQYMAPEQLEGRAADARSDVFAFGAVVFEMLVGRKAFAGATQAKVISAIMHDDPPPISTIQPLASAGFDRAIRKCLAKNADARWQSAGDLADELRWVANQPPIHTPSIAVRSGLSTRLAVPVLAVALGMAAMWAFVRPTDRASSDVLISFVIPPPDGVAWGDTPPEPLPSVSPDGQKVAFVGDSQEGHGVWVRNLGEAQAHLVPGSTDFGGPRLGLFWSSDSTRVGYCVRNSLKLHSFDDRPPEMLECGCIQGLASWNRSGEILFRREDGIFRISDRGGSPTRVTTVDSSRELSHSFPRWLPDGRRFIYTVVGPNRDVSGIYAGTPDGSSTRRILPDVSKSEYVAGADGASYLVFVRQNRLVAQPIDITTLATVGDPRVLAERMAIGNVALPSFSASATLLVHRSGGATRRSAWGWFDRQGGPAGPRYQGTMSATLSPDESTFVYSPSSPDGSVDELRMVDFARRIEQPLFDSRKAPSLSAFSSSGPFLPAFSRNGRRLAFVTIEPGSRQLYVMDFPNGKPTQLATSPWLGLVEPEWSPDDRALIGTDHLFNIVVVRLDSPGDPVTLVANGSQPQLSPDGRWMAYTSTVSGTPEVYVQSFPGGDDRQRVSVQGGVQPQWRGDGTELFYLKPDGTLMAVHVRTGPRFEAGEATRLFREPTVRAGATPFDRSYLPTRDGQRFLLHLPTEGAVPLTAVRSWLTPARK